MQKRYLVCCSSDGAGGLASAQGTLSREDAKRAEVLVLDTLGWLRQDFAADPTLRLRKLEDFVSAKMGGAERH